MAQRAVVYCRVSTDDQSCERQQRDLEAFASRAGYEIVGVFHENASGADDARPERRKVIELARGRKVDAVLVTELSRWGRSTVDLVNTLDDLHSWGVSVIAQTGLSFDLATPGGKLMRTLMAGLAEFERDLVRERVKSGMSAAQAKIARDGHFITRAGVKRASVGRPAGRSASTDRKAAKVHAFRAEGLSIRKIARAVGMSAQTVQTILKEPSPAQR